MTPTEPAKIELDLSSAELRVLVAVITHCEIYQRPIARCNELLVFMVDNSDLNENHASCATTRLIKRGLLQVVGRNGTMGGEHLLQHTPRAERMLGLRERCAAARERFWDEIRNIRRPEAAE